MKTSKYYLVLSLIILSILKIENPKLKYKNVKYRNEDVTNFASILNAECGICDDNEMFLFASVIYNRWNKTSPIDSVITAIGQFDGVHSVHFHPSKRTLRISKRMLSEKLKPYPKVKFAYNPCLSTDVKFINWAEKQDIIVEPYHNFF
jgi:hypothetical protein